MLITKEFTVKCEASLEYQDIGSDCFVYKLIAKSIKGRARKPVIKTQQGFCTKSEINRFEKTAIFKPKPSKIFIVSKEIMDLMFTKGLEKFRHKNEKSFELYKTKGWHVLSFDENGILRFNLTKTPVPVAININKDNFNLNSNTYNINALKDAIRTHKSLKLISDCQFNVTAIWNPTKREYSDICLRLKQAGVTLSTESMLKYLQKKDYFKLSKKAGY